MAPRTRPITLYHLLHIPRTLDALLEALDPERLDELGFQLEFPEIVGATAAILVRGHFERDVAEWCRDASDMTGLDLRMDDRKSAAVLVVVIDGNLYAIGFGQGYRLVPDEHKDPTFGLRVAVRSVDPDYIQEAVRRSMVGLGRIDATFSPGGLPIGRVGIAEHSDIVRKLSGQLRSVDLAIGGDRVIRIQGAAGLRLPVPTDGADLVTCIRAIAEICDTKPPHERLAFIEQIQPVGDRTLHGQLDNLLDQVLGREATAPIAPIVPVELLDRLGDTRSYSIEIGGATIRGRADLNLDDILHRCFVQPPGTRTAALRSGHIELCGAANGRDLLGRSPAIRWLEVTLALGPRQFFLLDGEWYEVGAQFMASIRRQVEAYIAKSPSVDLPEWEIDEDGKIQHEKDYNLRVQHERGRRHYLCLDRKSVRDELHKHGFEACDLLGPEDVFIPVKPASGSAPLSHLFSQALVSVSTLYNSPPARERFAAMVEEVSDGHREIPLDFRPKKVVFAILLKKGEELTADTLFPFSQVTLIHVAKVLETQYGIDVEVIGIHAKTT